MSDLRSTFLEEAADLLEEIERLTLLLEREERSQETLDAIFRAVHTLKGSAGVAEVDNVKELAHWLETLLEAVRTGEIQVAPELVDVVLAGFDEIKRLLAELSLSGEFISPDRSVLERIEQFCVGAGVGEEEFILPDYIDTSSLPGVVAALSPAFWEKMWNELVRGRKVYYIELEPGEDFFFNGHNLVFLFEDLEKMGEIFELKTLQDRLPLFPDLDPEKFYLAFEFGYATSKELEEVKDQFLFIASGEHRVAVRPLREAALQFLRNSELSFVEGKKLGEEVAGKLALLVEEYDASREEVLSFLDALLEEAFWREEGIRERFFLIAARAYILRYAELAMSSSGKGREFCESFATVLTALLNEALADGAVSRNLLLDIDELNAFFGAGEERQEPPAPAGLQLDLELVRILLSQQREALKLIIPAVEHASLRSMAGALGRVASLLGFPRPEREDRAGLKTWLEEVYRGLFEEQPEEKPVPVDDRKPQQQAPAPKCDVSFAREASFKISQEMADHLVNLVGELTIAKNSFFYLVKKLEGFSFELARELKERAAYLERLVRELQERVMAIRLLPVEQIFNRFPRYVRDTARVLGKQVVLLTEGEDTRLDKNMLEELYEPLLHLVRNSLDHGIENVEERVAAGKPAEGRLWLRAFQEGDRVVVEVEDDGRGIDTDEVKAKAIERGLLTAGEAGEMSEEEIQRLIFMPGFSTREEATDISGRGVGMDAVLAAARRLGGDIAVESRRGRGMKVGLVLPLTMSTTEVLKFRCGGRVFSFPLDAVVETVSVAVEDIKAARGKKVVVLREKIMPLVGLEEVLGFDGPGDRGAGEQKLIVLTRQFAVPVDAVLGKEEVLVRPLTGELKAIPYFKGAAILGDGSILLVLEPGALLEGVKCRVRAEG
ncbi:chemotaxis protein CheW [Desulfofundulus sp.]|uniref:chemotaxis protein CheA n=1 Tax=Desulfofundulus sp. TaxID=2282750 RepID=UPI003C794196